MNERSEKSLTTVMDYIAAVTKTGSGQFVGRFASDGQMFFASHYGAPFFAISQLAPELADRASINVLISDPIGVLAYDSGRWLSLFAKTQKQKFSCQICVQSRPHVGKPPKPILIQLPQQILVKPWGKHFRELDTTPDALLLYVPDGVDAFAHTYSDLRHLAAGQKALLSFFTRVDAIISSVLLSQLGFTTSAICGFPISSEEDQHAAFGAWWLSVTSPGKENLKDFAEFVDSPASIALDFYRAMRRTAKSKESASKVAACFGTRTTLTVGDQPGVQVLWLNHFGGIDLATGRFFTRKKTPPSEGEAFVWDEGSLDSKFVESQPKEDLNRTPDENRYAFIEWVAASLDTRKDRTEPGSLTSEHPPQVDHPATVVVQTANTDGVIDVPITDGSPSEPMPAKVVDANSVATEPKPSRPRLSRSAGTVSVLAMAAQLGKRGLIGEDAFVAARKCVLDWLASKGFKGIEPASDQTVEQPDGEVIVETDGAGVWALRFDDRRSMEQGAIWRVEITLIEAKGTPAVSLRMAQVRSSEDAPPPIASGVPSVVAAIAQKIGLQDAGFELHNNALRLKSGKDTIWFGNMLLNPNRSQPIVVISGSVDQSADRLAKRLVGVAHVVCIDHGMSDNLIHRFGRDRAVYGNAVRLYRPGFAPEADPFDHPLWQHKGTQLPLWLTNELFEQACAISLTVGDVEERAPSFQFVRNFLAEGRQAATEKRLEELRKRAESIASSADEKVARLLAVNRELETALAAQKEQNKKLLELATEADIARQSSQKERDDALQENRQLRFQIREQWTRDSIPETTLEDEREYPDNWDDLETWVEVYGEGRLVLLPQAIKAAKASPFKDISFVYKALEYLVCYYVPMKTRAQGDEQAFLAERQALAELGIEREPVGNATTHHRYKHEYRRQYDGRTITMDDHLKWGKSFDPATCFRLYFHFDESTGKVVVGHMPTHLTNRMTHSG